MEKSTMRIITSDQVDRQVDDSDDLWCEDGLSNDISDESFDNASLMDREWKRRHTHFHTMGYRDGLLAGKEVSAQDGFNAGFRQSVNAGYNWGVVRGITSSLAVLPDRLKEKLVGSFESRERFLKLYVSAKKISSNDAIKMVHNSILEAACASSLGANHDMALADEDHRCNQLEGHFKELAFLLHDAPDIRVNAELS